MKFEPLPDPMAATGYGRAALRKFGEVPAGFRLFSAEWLGDAPGEWKVMRVKGGAIPRHAPRPAHHHGNPRHRGRDARRGARR